MYCKECGKGIEDNSKFCLYCGSKVSIEKILEPPQEVEKILFPKCPNCKRDVTYTWKRCLYCGSELVPQKEPEKSYLIQCPKCKRDITRTSENCPYCSYLMRGPKIKDDDDDDDDENREFNFDTFQKGLAGCNKGLFQFGLAMTLLMALLGLLLYVLGII